MQDAFSKAKAGKTVFKRTKARQDLPSLVLYLEWLSGEMKRRVADVDGNEHLIADKVMQSYYKMVPGKQAKELLDRHWLSIATEDSP